jgi:DNA invertase Pin-like site-specific DNA recombinase
MEAVCTAEGWNLIGVVEEAASGGDRDREGLASIFADLGAIDKLLIAKVDRFGRSFSHNVALKDELDQAGVDLVFLEPRIDFSTKDGEFMWGQYSLIAQMERRSIGERVAATSKLHRAAGKAAGGPRPYGYRRRKEGGLIVDQAEAVIVLRIYREFVAGRTVVDIVRGLDADTIRTGKGAVWSPRSIDRLLKNPLYRGALVHKGVVVCEDADHNAIVDRDLWQRAQDLRAARSGGKSKGRGRHPKANHLFVEGMLRCGRCGSSMHPRTYPAGRGVYRCNGRTERGVDFCSQEPIDRATVDGAAQSYFSRVVLDREATQRQFEAVASLRLSEARVLSQQADAEFIRLRALAQRVEADYDAGDLSAKTWERKSATVAAELEGAEAQALTLAGQLEEAKASTEVSDAEGAVLRWLEDVRAAVAGEVADVDSVAALRAALLRVFDGFVFHASVDGRWQEFERRHGGDLAIGQGAMLEPLVKASWIDLRAVRPVLTTGMDMPKTNARIAT